MLKKLMAIIMTAVMFTAFFPLFGSQNVYADIVSINYFELSASQNFTTPVCGEKVSFPDFIKVSSSDPAGIEDDYTIKYTWKDVSGGNSINSWNTDTGADEAKYTPGVWKLTIRVATPTGYAVNKEDKDNIARTIQLGGKTFTRKSVMGSDTAYSVFTYETKFTVSPLPLNEATVTGITDKTYTGNAHTQSPVVTVRGNTLTEGQDYDVAYADNINAGANATVIITGKGMYSGSITKTFTIKKASNPLTIKAKPVTVKYKKLKKKNQKLAVTKVIRFTKDVEGDKTYTLSYAKKGAKSYRKYFKINKTSGKITIRKGLKKGKYSVAIKVRDKGNSNYAASKTKSAVIKIRVK